MGPLRGVGEPSDAILKLMAAALERVCEGLDGIDLESSGSMQAVRGQHCGSERWWGANLG